MKLTRRELRYKFFGIVFAKSQLINSHGNETTINCYEQETVILSQLLNY